MEISPVMATAIVAIVGFILKILPTSVSENLDSISKQILSVVVGVGVAYYYYITGDLQFASYQEMLIAGAMNGLVATGGYAAAKNLLK
jgi:hypothetical protein